MNRNRDRRGHAPLQREREPHRGGTAEKGLRPAAPRTEARRRGRDNALGRNQTVALIYGFHSVEAALKAQHRQLIRLYATPAAAARLAPHIAARGVETRVMSLEEITARAPRGSVHQGVLLEAHPLAPIELAGLPPNGLVVVLDQVTDPHNVGAIVRTAAAFAVDALVATDRHSPEFSGVIAKSASGGLEHLPVCLVPNLARALGDLGDLGYWRVGLDSQAPAQFGEVAVSRPLALVLGAEGRGLRRLTRDRCDVLARLDLPGAIKSLNVSNACAIALAIAHQRLPVEH